MNKLAVLLFFAVAARAQYQCKQKIDGYEYDLTRLYHKPGEMDNIYFPMTDGTTYFLNLCGYTSAPCDGDGVSMCQYASNGYYHSCGLLSTQTWAPNTASGKGKGVVVKYTGGEQCSGGPERSTTVRLSCLENEDPGYIYKQEESDCAYTLYMYSAAACGKKAGGGGLDAGGIILIILVCLIVLYFGLGAVYQWKFKEPQTFTDYIIHNSFWFAIPFLVKDGVMFIAHGFKKGDYTTV